MTFENLWARFTAGNPDWLTSGAILSPDGIKRILLMAWDAGHDAGIRTAKEYRMAEELTEREREAKAMMMMRRTMDV